MTLIGFTRIAVNPAICGGRPVIVGTRMRVSDVLEMLAKGATPREIAADFPYVTEDDVRAALAFAASQSDHPIVLDDALMEQAMHATGAQTKREVAELALILSQQKKLRSLRGKFDWQGELKSMRQDGAVI